jgi:hypothetical protein
MSTHIKYRKMFYQFYTAWKANTDDQFVRKDMDVNEHQKLSNFTL